MSLSSTTSGASLKKEVAAEPPPSWKFWLKPEEPEEPDANSTRPLPYWQLFKYANTKARLCFFVSLVCAVGHGVMLPILTVVFGDIIDQFAVLLNSDGPPVSSEATVEDTTRIFLILSFVAWVVSFFQLFFALRAANITGNILRTRFFNSLIRQHPAFYDDSKAGALTNLVVNDINLIQAGVGDKLATAVQYITTFITGLIVGFIKGWSLTLVILAVTPVLLLSGVVFGNASSEATGESLGSYSTAGGVASEVLGLIRTVTAFSSQESEARRYEEAVGKAYKGSAKAAVMSGAGLGIAMFFIISSYSLAFWFGSTRVRAGAMEAGDVLVTFFAITLGASSLGTAGPAFKSFGVARAAAPRVFEIIETVSEIDPLSDSDSGIILEEADVHGRLSFDEVDFNYTNRITEEHGNDYVLENFNLEIPPASSEALVGKSGCGKSTVARLIQRLYDPIHGCVRLDGVDLRELNVRWLRAQIGVVAQTPSLFMLSIRDNIALGAAVSFQRNEEGKTIVTPQQVTQEQIVEAAKMANAHDFISRLPEGYDTMLGERGAMLSGGQKQRVCIARALVRNPKILILDESTASLDTASERIVQEALERAASGRTTVTIAHRLSTVRNSNSISCIEDGKVIERGNHDRLIRKEGGFYSGLFEAQRIQREKLNEEKKSAAEEENGLQNEGPAVAGEEISTTKGPGTSLMKIDGKEESDKPAVDRGLFWRTLKLNSKELPLIFLGGAGAVVAAVVWPLVSIALVNMTEILVQDEISASRVRKWSLAFVVLAVAAFFGNLFQHGALGVSGERLTLRLRGMVFRQLLTQEMGYFDMEGNSLGALTTLLSSEAGLVKGLTGDLFGIGLNVVGSLLSALIIAFISCWQLTLVILAIIPGVALGGYFEMQASAGIDSGARKEFAEANIVAAEAVDNVATVRSLGAEEHFLTKFEMLLMKMGAGKLRKDLITATAFGFSEFCQYLIWYATFKAGSRFIDLKYCTFQEMLQTSMALLFGAITLGNVSVFAPDVASSNVSATRIYRLLDRDSLIDPMKNEGDSITQVQGNVSAEDVHFEYPRRPDVRVLRGLSLAIEQGKTLAIVGTSGHGKSTIISLLQRFYCIRKGAIRIDEQDVSKAKVNDVRRHIGLVSQEPELFNRSVYDNIAYGLPHEDGTVVTRDQVVEAAKVANAHDFIEGLPQGYDTMVGVRGDSLSGGQRQRVAIARSLIRKPPILLLDEATSALDGTSERLVQEALDQAGQGRTTIVVAHRLSTVRDADIIVVVRKGRVVESGTHDTLLQKNGEYAKLIESQLTDV